MQNKLQGVREHDFGVSACFLTGFEGGPGPKLPPEGPSGAFGGIFDRFPQTVKKSYYIWGSKIAPGTICWGFGLRIGKKGNRFGIENQYQFNLRYHDFQMPSCPVFGIDRNIA
jgi:hypothetical protein